MRLTRLVVITIAAAAISMPGFSSIYARGGGGGHMGGGGGGHAGGWSGGRAGGGGEYHGGGEFHGGGERRDEPGRGGEHRDRPGPDNRPDHRPDNRNDNNRNSNNGNTTNNVTVNGNGGDWGWGWGAGDDALAGMMIGAAIASNKSDPSTVIIEQPSTTVVQQAAPAAPAYGTQVTVLPAGCTAENVHGTMAYRCGSTWYRPYFGSNGVYYEVVQPPPAEGSVSMGQGH